MGLNDEYARDAYIYDQVWDSDDEDLEGPELGEEDWQDLCSQELLNGWMILRTYLDENYIESRATYNLFVNFVLYPSRWFSEMTPSGIQALMWSEMSRIPEIASRVSIQNFVAWTNNYIRPI